MTGGCSRKHYRTQADRQVAEIYQEKRAAEAWNLPPLPGIEVDPRSRFFDPSPPDCPALPPPEPRLYDYVLPELVTGDPNAPLELQSDEQPSELEGVEATDDPAQDEGTEPDGPLELNEAQKPDGEPGDDDAVEFPELIVPEDFRSVSQVSAVEEVPPSDPQPTRLPAADVTTPDEISFAALVSGDDLLGDEPPADLKDEAPQETPSASKTGLRIVPIPADYWGRIPQTCVPRMLEFESVRDEYRLSFPDDEASDIRELLSDAPRLTLPNIMELTVINSREYQTRKETLYRVALRLTQERFEFLLRPTRRGNGTALNYQTIRVGGITNDRLGIPTSAAVTQTLNTGGQFLASFANDVVLTFNGPQGFSSRVGSELLFDFQQTLLQRDIVFESLTQAERDVVYAARDLIRFRRQLAVDLAGRYYNLLLTYRAIEISSQDYFSNLRAFLQGRAEYLQAGRIPRIQVDQFEQNALRSQSDLVGDCNRLETSLDRLKLEIGLPPEMPMNISLLELDALTSSDELTVTRQLVQRTKQALMDTAASNRVERDAVVNGATVLVDRLDDTLRVRRQIEGGEGETDEERGIRELRRLLSLFEVRLRGDQLEEVRRRELNADRPPLLLLQFARTVDLVDARLQQARRALLVREMLEEDDGDDAMTEETGEETPDADGTDEAEGDEDDIERDRIAGVIGDYESDLDALVEQLDLAIPREKLDILPDLVKAGEALKEEVEKVVDLAVGDLLPADDQDLDDVIAQTVADTIALVDRIAGGDVGGLDEVDVQDDEAMLIALVQRLDLMNQRGELADARRQIKLAADDLRSIIDIRATHILRTNSAANRPFDFTFDDSETRLSLGLDTPLNRRIERNNYRLALINYNATRRALIEQQDQIKFSIRESLRQLRLRRNQYEIAVASAALAYERVVSTRLQLQLAVGNVVARDFLEAQQAYTSALNAVAREHISFILGRIDLFLQMEAVRVDPNGYWAGVDDEQLDLPLRPPFLEANPNPYGELPPCLHYSDEIRCLHGTPKPKVWPWGDCPPLRIWE